MKSSQVAAVWCAASARFIIAGTPREAVDFARMVTRAFYPPEFVVALDAILRNRNYCAHHNLARRLEQPPKELRITLNRMVHVRLVAREQRVQTRIFVLEDDRRRSRSVSTEFWFVPLRELLDAFIFRVHRVSQELEQIISRSEEQRNYVCKRCGTAYDEDDIGQQVSEDGLSFICDRLDVVAGRRLSDCGGKIEEESNADERQEAEVLKVRLDTQLRPLRERAEKCLTLEIPAHPMQNADAKT